MTGCSCNPRVATLDEDLNIVCGECGMLLEKAPDSAPAPDEVCAVCGWSGPLVQYDRYRNPVGHPVHTEEKLAAAGYRKHPEPEPEWEYGVETFFRGRPMGWLVADSLDEARQRTAAGNTVEAREREEVRFTYVLSRRPPAVPPGPWVPVGEGEAPNA